jgi:hypothetical protein
MPYGNQDSAMTVQTTLFVDSAPVTPIEGLIARSGDLKRELVTFAQSRRFARQLTARLSDAVDRRGYLDEGMAVRTIDHFALQHPLPDGRTVLEVFVEQRRPPLPDDEREMMLGWRDVVEGCFEVCRVDGSAVMLHNLIDDVVYRVHSNMGRRALAPLRKGKFAVGRVVPVHPATDAWLISGHYSLFPRSAGPQLARAALETLTANPELLRRNPELLRRAWELQAEYRAGFIALFGSDLVVLSPPEAQEQMREHYRRQMRKADANRGGKTAKLTATGHTLDELGQLPEELLDADSIALVYDEVEGLNYYRDFGHLDDLFADPSLARDRAYLTRLQEYLDDESVSPLAIRRLVQRHPDGADPVFRALLRKPGFCWERDGEKLLRRWKKAYFDREPTPSISTIGERLAELLRTRR